MTDAQGQAILDEMRALRERLEVSGRQKWDTGRMLTWLLGVAAMAGIGWATLHYQGKEIDRFIVKLDRIDTRLDGADAEIRKLGEQLDDHKDGRDGRHEYRPRSNGHAGGGRR